MLREGSEPGLSGIVMPHCVQVMQFVFPLRSRMSGLGIRGELGV